MAGGPMTLERMFTLQQVLDIIGLLQCAFILALIGLKARDLRRAGLTVAFFAVLGLGFGLPGAGEPQLAYRYSDVAGAWLIATWIPVLSYLLILQVAIERLPTARHLTVLVVPVLAAIGAFPLIVVSATCNGLSLCPEGVAVLRAFGVIPGAITLLLLLLHRGLLEELRPMFWMQRHMRTYWSQSHTHRRYWVVLTLIIFNALNLGVDLSRGAQGLGPGEATFVHTIFGLTFVYLVTTLMFRIKPAPVRLLPGRALRHSDELTPEERALADRIRDLIALEAYYKVPTLRPADVARHLDVSERLVSRVMKDAFGKSFAVFLIDHRVEEAKRLLRGSDLSVTQIAFDVGFDSLPSFNVVFKKITGQSPTEYRAALAAVGNSETTDEQPDALGAAS